jgi:hypothetical protein
MSDFQRLQKVLDLVLRTNIHLEFEVSHDHVERLKNEKHLVVEQREALLRKRMVNHSYLQPRQENSQSRRDHSTGTSKNCISDYFTSLGDHRALSTYRLKTLVGEINENYAKDAKDYATQRATNQLEGQKNQGKRSKALRPSYEILRKIQNKLQKQFRTVAVEL